MARGGHLLALLCGLSLVGGSSTFGKEIQDPKALLKDAAGNVILSIASSAPGFDETRFQGVLLNADRIPVKLSDVGTIRLIGKDGATLFPAGVDAVELFGPEDSSFLFGPEGILISFAEGFSLTDRDGKTISLPGKLVEGPNGGFALLREVVEDGARQALEMARDLPDFLLGDADKLGLARVRDSFLLNGQLKAGLGNPNTLNSILAETFRRTGEFHLLEGLTLKPQIFQADDARSGIGFSYDYGQDFFIDHLDRSPQSGLSISLDAQGNVAFDSDINPQNFLRTKLAINHFWNFGGTRAEAFGKGAERERILNELNDLEDLLAGYDSIAELDNSQEWKRFSNLIQRGLTTQVFVDVSVTGGLESNQSFSNKNWVLGPQIALDIKAWNPDSFLAKANIFDYPFALLRLLTGYDSDWETKGSTLPTILVAFDRVQPNNDKIRMFLGDNSDFWRWRAEVSFKTPIARFGETPYYIAANYRFYQELDASRRVKAVDFDRSTYFTMTLGSDEGIFVSYSTGKLPFDRSNDQIYQVGWQLNF